MCAAPTAYCSSGWGSLCWTVQKYRPSLLWRPAYLLALSKTTDVPWRPPGNKLALQRLHPDPDGGPAQERGSSGCTECLSLLLPGEGGRNSTCGRCEQVEDLLSMVAELKEEVETLQSIRE